MYGLQCMSFYTLRVPHNTHTLTPTLETRAPSGCDEWLQHLGHFQITGSDRGSFNESFVCVSSQAFQAADE